MEGNASLVPPVSEMLEEDWKHSFPACRKHEGIENFLLLQPLEEGYLCFFKDLKSTHLGFAHRLLLVSLSVSF